MYKMIVRTEESDISKERIILRYCKLIERCTKGHTAIKNIKIINTDGEIIREYDRN